MNRPLNVAILWHMHQPSYVDPDSQRSLMPWVRLHAMKDYYDMGRLVNETEGAAAVFNFVPSLWDQLERIAKGEWLDDHERISRKPAESLDGDERLFVAQHFFSCPYDTMIAPYPVFRELYHRFGPQGDARRITGEDVQTVVDLQVWFHLAWCGHTLQEDPFVAGLMKKATGFSHDEKIQLLDLIRAFIAEIPYLYREMAAKGRAEISATPYYHPILPVLIDPDSPHVACPNMALPRERLALELDAYAQIERAQKRHEGLFGHKPQGFWPAEGSVSPQAAKAFAERGLRWIATDENVLKRSLEENDPKPEDRYRPWTHNGVAIFFRNLFLSDRIGFEYSHFRPEEAVADFIKHLHEIRASLPDDGDYIVPVILDGENCWEFYKRHGWDFLLALYTGLVGDGDLKLTTFSQYLDGAGQIPELAKLHSGSWISADFTTWVGDPIKNKAWTLLYQALKAAARAIEDGRVSDELRPQLQEIIYTAEGSDWFWWFGEGHTSDYDALFDLLFRKYLTKIYKLIGEDVPANLKQPVDDRWLDRKPYSMPAYTIHPRIDGNIGHYWEWLAAGICRPTGGSMQRGKTQLSELRFGFDNDHLFFRLETPLLNGSNQTAGMQVQLRFQRPSKQVFHLNLENGAPGTLQSDGGLHYAVGDCIEAELPFELITNNEVALKPGDPIEFSVVLTQDGRDVERLPDGAVIHLPYPAESYDDENWFI